MQFFIFCRKWAAVEQYDKLLSKQGQDSKRKEDNLSQVRLYSIKYQDKQS